MVKVFKQSVGIMVYLLILILTLSVSNIHAQLVTNGSFENTDVGPVTGLDVDGWVIEVGTGVSPAPVFEIVEDPVQDGNHALKVVVNGIGPNDWSIQIVADSIPVVPGTAYSYSVWAKTANPSSQANFTVGNYAYNEYGRIHKTALSNTWQEFTLQFTVTDQETFIRAPIHFSMAANVGDSIYIDNLRIFDTAKELVSRNPIVFEADSGVIGSDFAVKQDEAILYIQIQTDGADYTPAIWDYPGFESRVATYEITFPMGGTYNLFAHIRVGPNQYNDDSFFYGNGFGVKDTTNADDWITVNQLNTSGFSVFSDTVLGPGEIAAGVWKWVNLSQNSYYEAARTFDVDDDSLTVTFQIGGRETGLDIDQLAFGRADLYFTVGDLEGEEEEPIEIYKGPPLATGHSKFLGCAHSPPQAVNFTSYWNQVTPENGSKWGSVEGTRDVMNWGALDAAYNLAKDNGFPFRFHVLIWGNQQPVWIEALSDSTEEQLEEIREWFEAVAERYPAIDYLEVVNEPLHDPPDGPTDGNYIDALGGKGDTGWDWVLNAFRMAREIFPSTTKLLINEYNIINTASNVTKYLEVISLLQAENLIDGIGIQCHAPATRGPVATMTTNLNTLATAGLPIQVTELDIDGPTDQIQLEDYQRIFPVIWEHPAVIGITLWGWRPGLWRNAYKAYIIEANGAEKPALEWLRGYVPSTVSVDDYAIGLPQSFRLDQNYPNPFNLETKISFQINIKSQVILKIYDVLGQCVRTLIDQDQPVGKYTITWDATDNIGIHVATGVYIYRIEIINAYSSTIEQKKAILLK